MAFHGDFSSYPLPELLQWLDGSRKTGALHVQWDAGERKVFLLTGQIVATAAPGLWEHLARALEQGGMASGQRVLTALETNQGTTQTLDLAPEVEALVRELAADELIASIADLTQVQAGRFHWSEDPDRGNDEWVPLSVPLRHLLFESLRWVDELPDIERALPHDTMTVLGAHHAKSGQPVVQRAILHACQAHGPLNLGRLRLLLGVQRGLVLRAVHDLWRAKKVQVEGTVELEPDPVADMLEKGAILLRERQFEAAAMVFSALLISDPSDRRVREFLRMVEREHVASLYRELPPVSVLDPVDDPEALAALRPDERQIASMVNGRWDVSAIVLAGQLRELDTLKTLFKLRRMGLIADRPPQSA
ncbi:MAG: DUF4388 domain-containing protein [Myxococcaceae bacterium]|nr:DUF4388 domain-containing protein [Myxococcaceae bacterium]